MIVSAEFNECVMPLLVALDVNFVLLTTTNRIPSYIKYSLGIPEQPSFRFRIFLLFLLFKSLFSLFHFKGYYNLSDFLCLSANFISHVLFLSTFCTTFIFLNLINFVLLKRYFCFQSRSMVIKRQTIVYKTDEGTF